MRAPGPGMQGPAPGRPPPLPGELAAWRELVAVGRQWSALGHAPRGSGRVVVVPGYGCADPSTTLLRAHLRRLGWAAAGWGLGRNTGALGRQVEALEARLAAAGPAHLVGWSFGGVIARELARRRPELVPHVLTLGTPVQGGPRHTALARQVAASPERLAAIAEKADAREARPIGVPVDVLYAPGDAVVDWRACLDRRLPPERHHALPTTHMGLVAAPVALGTVAALLWAESRGRS